jgi:hypothetical protein
MKVDRANIITTRKHDGGCKCYLLSIEGDAYLAFPKDQLTKKSPLATCYRPQKHLISAETPTSANKRSILFAVLL